MSSGCKQAEGSQRVHTFICWLEQRCDLSLALVLASWKEETMGPETAGELDIANFHLAFDQGESFAKDYK